MQTTINDTCLFRGTGLHSGHPVEMTICPAPANHGIKFRRTDADISKDIPALWNYVIPSRLCTTLGFGNMPLVSTIEHVMFALAACGVHNALVCLDGPEVPIMDGSAEPFVSAIRACGTHKLREEVQVLRVLRPVAVSHGDARAELYPAALPRIEFEIDFDDPAIGKCHRTLQFGGKVPANMLSDSRTFCMNGDIEEMKARGLALGGSLDNAVVFDNGKVLTPGGLRHRDEPLRHKMLDAIGDLALAGAPILGQYIGRRAGHALTRELLVSLFAQKDAWEMVPLGADENDLIPSLSEDLTPHLDMVAAL
jgi:UDP-3-O-[3-hydroxymyristoyl] N-acetylglucosamine deacetylase